MGMANILSKQMQNKDELAFEGDFQVQTDVYESITEEAENNPKQETGGMLFGSFHSTGDNLTVIVEEAAQIPSEAAKRTAAHFGIAPTYADRMLDEHCPRYVYLGNWHSHLNYGGPSQGDYQQVSRFFQTNQNRDLMIAMIMDRQELRPPSFAPIAEVYTRDDTVSQGYRIAQVEEVRLYDDHEDDTTHTLGAILTDLEIRQSLLAQLTELIANISQQTPLPVDDTESTVYMNRGGAVDEIILCFPLEYEAENGEDTELMESVSQAASETDQDADDSSSGTAEPTKSTSDRSTEGDSEGAEKHSEPDTIDVYLKVSVPLIYPDGEIYVDLASRDLTQQLTVGTYAASSVDESPEQFTEELSNLATATIPNILDVPLADTIGGEIV